MTAADVVIVGAGPAGLAAALRLRALGVEKIVLLDRQGFPRDKTCGSAVSPKGIEVLRQLGVFDEVSERAHWVNGMRLVTPAGQDVRFVGQSDAALVCNRRIFDGILLNRAQAMGVVFEADATVDHLLTRDERIIGCQTRAGLSVKSRFTVVADGAKSRFTLDRGPRRTLQTIMGWWDDVDHASNEIEMFFDPLVAPLYGWLFPESGTRVNIGICYEDRGREKNGRALFQAFLDRHFAARIARGRAVGGWKGHPISYSLNIGRLSSPGRFVAGEAARLTHPATGEGIYQAMASGIAAAEAIAGVIGGATTEPAAAAAYEADCRRTFAVSFKVGMMWRRLVSAGALDVAVKAANLPFVRKSLATTMAHM